MSRSEIRCFGATIMLSAALSLGVVSAASVAHAEREIGNGGEVVVCAASGHDAAPELLDHFEARERYAFTIDMGQDGLSASEHLHVALARLARLDPDRAAAYRQDGDAFLDNAAFVDGPLPSTDDTGFVALPTGCRLEQIVVQIRANLPGQRRYNISRSWWSQLSELGRAGLILHEVIFAHEPVDGDATSVRYFGETIARPELGAMPAATYVDLLGKLGFPVPTTTAVGDLRCAGAPVFYASGAVHECRLAAAETVTIGSATYRFRDFVMFYESGALLAGHLAQGFHSEQDGLLCPVDVADQGKGFIDIRLEADGRLASVATTAPIGAPATSTTFAVCVPDGHGGLIHATVNSASFYASGAVQDFGNMASSVTLPVAGTDASFLVMGWFGVIKRVSFYESGHVSRGLVEGPFPLTLVANDGTPLVLTAQTDLDFDEDGRVAK